MEFEQAHNSNELLEYCRGGEKRSICIFDIEVEKVSKEIFLPLLATFPSSHLFAARDTKPENAYQT